ncbi:hypothetical protein L2E82_26172 [Cichorium intybus]|uniref:Uncharacterized protein n=1 Tax=Cichorium intybus TaxID=13427 RepID=A0ACB9E502_CICIN|nr:hypothetical protein L2E82_26172 [Cichorium intybus]
MKLRGVRAVSSKRQLRKKRIERESDPTVGWGKLDFGLLGTSNGGCLPRVQEKQLQEDSNFKKPSGKGGGSGGVGREKRLETELKRMEHQVSWLSADKSPIKSFRGDNHIFNSDMYP